MKNDISYEKIKERVDWGEEFLFCYENEDYWISQKNSKRYLTRVRGGITQEFQSTDDLFEQGRIEGKSLLEIWSDIKQYF